MGKAQFYDRFLFILITTITAFLVSGIASTETDGEIKRRIGKSIHRYNKYHSLEIHYVNYRDGVDFLWKNMKSDGNATKLSDDQFVDGKALIDLPFGFQLFDQIVTRVAVTKQGKIQSADPSVNWTIALLNAEPGTTRCNISYLFQEKNLYVQWNNFDFKYAYYQRFYFSFQVRLGERGEIVFVYKKVPFDVTSGWREYCKCLRDKYGVMYRHQELFQVPPYKKTYELGFSMALTKYALKDGTVVSFYPADRCMFQKNCFDCCFTEYRFTPNFTAPCLWCPAIEKCSSTRDSLRNVWMENKCDVYHVNETNNCHIDFLGNQRFMFGVVVVLAITIPVIAAFTWIKLKDKIVGLVRYIIESKWLRERIQPTNQPNEPVDDNQAEDQNNNQEDQEQPGDHVIEAGLGDEDNINTSKRKETRV